MAPKQKRSANVLSKSTFANTLHTIARRFSLSSAFDDFLTMAIAAYTQNLETKKSWYEEEYLATIAKYKDSKLRFEFPNAFSYLILEMEERLGSSQGNDVLGEFFEQHISNGRNGQFFTPNPLCQFMASITHTDKICDIETDPTRSVRILDPACGSGRMLLASHRLNGSGHEYYGIDVDRTCAKMAALNLFLNGIWNSEVMCANALMPNDFVIAYRISFLPLGIFKIEMKEHSKLWRLQQSSFALQKTKAPGADITLDPTPFSERKKDNTIQLDLF